MSGDQPLRGKNSGLFLRENLRGDEITLRQSCRAGRERSGSFAKGRKGFRWHRNISVEQTRLLQNDYRAAFFFCCRKIPARARKDIFTASAFGNILATSGSRSTTLVPCA